MKKYIPAQFEAKWQKKWVDDQLYKTDLSKSKNKFYNLVELPYTSGDLHMGHWFTFTQGDIVARFKRMGGYNVLFPNGYDTFGLPAENAAIRNKMHPRDWTYANIKRMRQQFNTMGVSIDFDKTAVTCEPEYYKWNQWLFLKMYERGIAYRGETLSNWCPQCKTVLADENVELGRCWRCGSEVTKKQVKQWFFKLTDFADRLLWQDPPQVDWPKPLRESQNNWIGKSEGVVIKFPSEVGDIEVFTTRQDTIFGATFLVISPEHPLLDRLVIREKRKEISQYIEKSKKKSELERKEERVKSGVFTGAYVKNPLSGKKVPVWVADYVLMSYGTGAVMGVPAHDQRDFEFATKYKLDISSVIEVDGQAMSEGYEGEGVLINSDKYNGLTTFEAREKISDYLEQHHLAKRQTNYHLHDWSISRQRYWGTPIPIIYCSKCGVVPVPEKDLPVELPYEVDYTPRGKPPLATNEQWVKVKCPNCGGLAEREVETMDGFVDNSWYFYRYLDHQNSQEIFDQKIIAAWLPVNLYNGGAEHTVGHTLYSRFFTKFFHDLGLVDFEEYALKRVNHGVILGPDGHRMSKSRGNFVNPDEEAKKYGADAVRIYLMFLGPFDVVAPWNPDGIGGVYHFLQRAWGIYDKVITQSKTSSHPEERYSDEGSISKKDLQIMHKTIKKVDEDIDQMKFNTAIAALMEWLNHLSRKEVVSHQEYKTMLLLLAPFAPHMSEELWQIIGESYSIHQQSWPKFDKSYQAEEIALVIQVNGRVRDTILIDKDMVNNNKIVEKKAKDSKKIQKFIEGKIVKKTVYIPGKIINFVLSK